MPDLNAIQSAVTASRCQLMSAAAAIGLSYTVLIAAAATAAVDYRFAAYYQPFADMTSYFQDGGHDVI